MAKLSNINGKFAVEDTGAIRFSDQTGTTGQILKSNGNSAPTWVDPNTVGTGPWLPLAGGILTGATSTASGISFTVGGILTGTSATFNGLMKLDAGGILQFGANTATPSMGVAIHRSAADTLNFVTASTNRLTIDSSGNVGIGGTPSTFANFTNVTIQGGSSGSNLDFKNSSGTRVSAIVTTASNELIIETGTAQPIIFKTNDTETMRITSGGDVYIGNSAITTANTAIFLNKSGIITNVLANSGGTTDLMQFYQQNGGGIGTISRNADGICMNGNGQTNQLVVADSGNVGIATTAIPTNGYTASGGGWKMLQIGQSSQIAAYGTDDEIGIFQNTYLNTSGVFQAITSNVMGSSIILVDGKIYFKNAATSGTAQTTSTRMLIDSSGNVTVNDGGFFLNKSDGAYMALKHNNSLKGYLGIANQVITGGSTGDIGLTATSNLVFGSGGTTERMRIDQNGDISMNEGLAIQKMLSIGTNQTSGRSLLTIRNYDASLVNTGDLLSELLFTGRYYSGSSSQLTTAGINLIKENADGYGYGGALAFDTGGGAEAMRITSAGHTCFGTTSVANVVAGDGSAFGVESNNRMTLFQGTNSAAAMTIQAYYNPNGQVGRINTTGSTTQFLGSSDYRLKEDLQDFNGLDKVSKIPVYDFKWKTGESRSYGVMAHELQEVLPDAVSGEKDAVNEDGSINPQGVDYSKIVPLLVKAIQELEARIKILENK